MKTCSKCGEEKELSFFSTYKTRKGEIAYKAACKVCAVKDNLRKSPS